MKQELRSEELKKNINDLNMKQKGQLRVIDDLLRIQKKLDLFQPKKTTIPTTQTRRACSMSSLKCNLKIRINKNEIF